MSINPDSPRTLVLGSNGQLGRALRLELPQATFFDRTAVDLCDRDSIQSLDLSGVDFVINAAAYTAVDQAETSEGEAQAWAINARAVELIAKKCVESNAVLVQVSSDYVFDGTSTIPYMESDRFNPLGVYGKTKAAGDLSAESIPHHYIVRTSWVIGEGNNFVRTMASLAERGIEPSVVNDQIGRLTFTQDLAAGIAHLVQNKAPYGTYNLSNEGPASSWADIAARVYELTGRPSEVVTGVSTTEYFAGKVGISPRPLWSMLNLDKIEATGFLPASWEDRLKEYLS